MDWPVLVIALIPVAVWILATIFRGVEEVQRENRPQPRERGELRVPRRPAGELDRFLQEARDRRETPPPRPRLVEESEPVARPVLVPVPMPSRREEPRPKPVPTVPVAPVAVTAPPPAPPPPPIVWPRQPASPVIGRLYDMLRDRDTQALALVLREVFDKPVSQRIRKPPAG